MCGIYGCWSLHGAALDLGAVERATTLLRHRGPDDEGYYLSRTVDRRGIAAGGCDTSPHLSMPRIGELAAERFDLALGFRRLSILDLSPAGHQPMGSADGRHWMVYNGEVYNFVELRTELEGLGHRFRSDCDTEVILAAYREWGTACFHRFNGMWALAIWDAAEGSLLLCRDRFGVKPLFYTLEDGRFAFASEIKALVGAHGIAFRPSERAVYDFLASAALPSPTAGDTFFEGVRALPPGCLLRVRPDGTALERYYALPLEEEPAGEPARVAEEYAELLADAVRLRLRSDVAVGSCLSGGVDSSSIVCLVNGFLRAEGHADAVSVGDRQKAFSAVYHTEGRYNERPYIETVLAATGAEANFTFPTAKRLAADAARMVWHQDEPFLSTSIFAQWCVMAAARERGVTVLLDGQGADEALAGYRPYEIYVGELLRSFRLVRAAAELRALRGMGGVSGARVLAHALARQLPDALKAAGRRRHVHADSGALRPEFAGEHGAAPLRASAATLNQALAEQLTETSLPHLLRYEDRNSMAFSVEARVPFVDYRLIEFAMRRTRGVRIRDGWTKWVLRRGMQGRVPGEILWRRDKVGFETPEAEWLRSWMRGHPETFADGAASGRYLDLPAVRRELGRVVEGGGSSRKLWRWINLELWLAAWSTS